MLHKSKDVYDAGKGTVKEDRCNREKKTQRK